MRALERMDHKKIAVVLVDLQRGYCDPASDFAIKMGWDVSDADRVCREHVAFLESIRKILPPEQIIWLKMEEADDTFAANMAYGPGLSRGTFVPLCVRGTSGHDFHIVQPAPFEPQFLKFHFSGFHSEEFRNYLPMHGITQLAFTGVLRSRCVNATVIAASSLGYECILVDDLVSGPSNLQVEMQEHGKMTNFFYAQPIQSADFIERLQHSRRISGT